MRILSFQILMLMLLLAGCSAKPPAWIGGTDPRFPAESYLLGVGLDRTRSGAEDRARGQIAKTLQVKIDSLDRIEESEWRRRAGEESVMQYRQAVQSELTATTQKVLEGVEIREVWQDPKQDDFFALALLDRVKAGFGLRLKLDDLDQALLEEVRQAEQSSSPVKRISHYVRAQELLDRREVIAGDLRVVDFSGIVPEAPASRSRIVAASNEAAAQIRFGVELDGDSEQIVKGALVKTLAGLGLTLAPEWERNLTVRGTVTTEEYDTADPWHWSVASAQVFMVEKGGETIDSRRVSVREGSQVASRSRTLALEQLGAKLSQLLVEGITFRAAGKE